jgi:hypothetical protein
MDIFFIYWGEKNSFDNTKKKAGRENNITSHPARSLKLPRSLRICRFPCCQTLTCMSVHSWYFST